MQRSHWIKLGMLLLAGGILFYIFPLFHIQPRESGLDADADHAVQPTELGAADPVAYVEDFWNRPLRIGEGAHEVEELWNAFDADANAARSKFGRQVGLGGAWYFLIRGAGTVETVQDAECTLTATDSQRRVDIVLGVIVDNTVREAIGVDVNAFANSQDFNAVSSELNRRVEQEVIAPHRARLIPGASVRFVGCASIRNASDLDPIRVVPVSLEVMGENLDRAEPVDSLPIDRSAAGPSP